MPGVFELLHRGWNLFAKHLRSYSIFLLAFFVITLASSLITAFYGPTVGTINARNWNELASFAIISFPLFLFTFWASMALLRAMFNVLTGTNMPHIKVFTTVLKRFVPSVITYILTSLTMAVGAVLMAGSLLNATVNSLVKTGTFSFSALSGFGLIAGVFLLIFGFVIVIYLTFSYLEALLAGKGIVAAIKSSYNMVHGRFWQVFWLIVMPALILSSLAYILGVITDKSIIILLSNRISIDVAYIINMVIASLIAILVGPWSYATSLHLYKALKETQS